MFDKAGWVVLLLLIICFVGCGSSDVTTSSDDDFVVAADLQGREDVLKLLFTEAIYNTITEKSRNTEKFRGMSFLHGPGQPLRNELGGCQHKMRDVLRDQCRMSHRRDMLRGFEHYPLRLKRVSKNYGRLVSTITRIGTKPPMLTTFSEFWPSVWRAIR